MEWISVKERPPEDRDEILIITEDCEYYVCDYFPSVNQFWVNECELLLAERVTHWMPLPPPPHEVDDSVFLMSNGREK